MIVTGALLSAGGASMIEGGGMATVTVVGAEVGIPVAAVGVATMVVGSGISANAIKNMAGPKTYQTYTKPNPDTGEVYSGMTGGAGTPKQNIAK